ncbi:orotidine-5'-phosphate decarboxylase [Mollicutes bacterium LVI A0039]|nr:orotidine-5'-phosphate decarboxylase [Mollicutes bacterium LVI A0039]
MYNSKIMIALDFKNKELTLDFLNKFQDEKLFVKVGMELFYKEGPQIISEIKAMGHNIFLDLKLYDIPNTVSKAVHSLGSLGVDMLTIHTSGGVEMLTQANAAAKAYNLNLLGVTVLTSQDVSELVKTDYCLEEIINDLADKANQSGLYGIICSAQDIPGIEVSDNNLKYITPGIRLDGDSSDDQKRVMTPNLAIDNGADFLVVGRSITTSSTPYETYKQIQKLIGE